MKLKIIKILQKLCDIFTSIPIMFFTLIGAISISWYGAPISKWLVFSPAAFGGLCFIILRFIESASYQKNKEYNCNYCEDEKVIEVSCPNCVDNNGDDEIKGF